MTCKPTPHHAPPGQGQESYLAICELAELLLSLLDLGLCDL